MYRRVMKLVAPIALFGLAACGVETIETDMTLDDAVYMSALEEEDLGTEEGEDPADSEEVSEEVDACSLEAIRERVMNRFDRNQDGQVDGDEQSEMSNHFGGDENSGVGHGHAHGRRHGHHGLRGHGHKKLKRLKFIYDVDGSGDLSDEERAVLEGDLVARCENKRAYLLENFDADGSGDLSDEEKEAARDARRAAHEERRAQRLAEIDTDGDGEVSSEERAAAREGRESRCEARRAAMLEQFDADGDGELNEEETNALREYLREWVRGEHIGEGRPF